LIAAAVSIGSGFFAIVGFYLAGRVLGDPISLHQAFLFTPIIIIANTLPLSPGGLGIGESVSSILYQQAGYCAGAELMLVYRIGITLLRLPGGLIYMLSSKPTA